MMTPADDCSVECESADSDSVPNRPIKTLGSSPIK